VSEAVELTGRHCSACEAGISPLTESDAAKLAGGLDPDWERTALHIRRSFRFADFRDTFAFATKVALLAEAEGHHPELLVRWGRLVVTLTTNAANGLTDNDFIMAAKIDTFVGS